MKKLLLLCSLLLSAGIAGAQCTASISGTQNPQGNSLLNVSFTNSSLYGLPFTGQKKEFNINFGDISSANNVPGTAIPDHVYPAPGVYTVGFRMRSYDSATNTTICTDTTTIIVTVAYPACGSTVSMTGTGATKTFTATTPAGTTGMVYSWNFGDGNTGSGSPVTHTYAASGNYNVTLTATSTSPACTYTNVFPIVVYIPPPALNCGLLHASFSSSVTANVATFTNTSNVASGSYQTIATWDYGDGTTGAGYNTPPHGYSAAGVYTVKLVMNWKDSLNTTSCKDSTTRTITVFTAPTPTNIISGNIFYNSSGGTNFFKVYLIRYDSATNWLSAVDSTLTGNTASPYYAFGNKAAGSYRVKAVVQNGSYVGTGLIPTYHDSSAYWYTAKVISHAGSSTLNKNIYMRTGTATSGSGFIGGNVSFGANKGASTGVRNLMIFLRDANMRIIQTTLTDSMGNYSFPNIPLGPYSIWPELINYQTWPITPIQLNATYPTRTDIDFYQDDNRRNIAPTTGLAVGSNGGPASDYIRVAPVPASGSVTISWNGMTDATTQFTLTSITGQVVARTGLLQGTTGNTQLRLNGVASGVYFLHGSGSLAAKVVQVVVE